MTASDTPADPIIDTINRLRSERASFALATVVRTVAATAAKAGAKAVILEDGTMLGWIGGGCAQGAVLRAVKRALGDGEPRLISVQPNEILSQEGVKAGETRDGVEYYRSHCPSRGTVDIFIEPMRPQPLLLVCGVTPVGCAVVDLGPRFGFDAALAASPRDLDTYEGLARRIAGFDDLPSGNVYAVVATQGRGDMDALKAVLSREIAHVAFVGSRAKAASLRDELAEAGIAPERIAGLSAPAGIDIGAITPEEIALSILAEIVQVRRAARRKHMAQTGVA
ncbi:xanthine dehydrogenase accessory factor [Breoghania corrubedonensis]|uniref:Xanthine dehydrogenase accessory factor n=1 Tax=Breoghania corrubedonensis TaxID=665038 RepID=A0A2T5V1E6_9HYPH|nr:XdhC family protein [Breoghania corrubedonensis]PTW57584.1 xanthine dehydrogenase accessory factor [Breoghania corrubedonensis]